METVFLSKRFNGELKGHDVVGGAKSLGILKVDLVLACGDLVV